MPSRTQVTLEHYKTTRYEHKGRFATYWHQIDQVVSRCPQESLEVGVGNGFVHRYLRQFGWKVHTADLDARLQPDVVSSVLALPFADGAYDLVCCFETLEHLPWENFRVGLRELARVARRWVLLSLPDVTPLLGLQLRLKWGKVQVLRDLPSVFPRKHEFDGQHYWEIGKRGYPLPEVLGVIRSEGLRIETQFRVFEVPYHRFISCLHREAAQGAREAGWVHAR
jgi:hypothetical protein